MTDGPTRADALAQGKDELLIPSGRVGLGPVAGCAVNEDFSVTCWGSRHGEDVGGGNRNRAPSSLRAVAVSGHHHSACAILKNPPAPDQAIMCFGSSVDGNLVRPPRFANPVYITSGEYHSCAIARDQTAVCWAGNIASNKGLAVPEGVKLRAICSMGYNCGITSDQSVLCWGGKAPRLPAGLADSLRAKRIACGGGEGYAGPSHACAIDVNDEVVCWGDNGGGATNVPAGLKASAIAAGLERTCAVALDGKVVCWGRAISGRKPPEKAASLFMHMLIGAAITPDNKVAVFGDYKGDAMYFPPNVEVAP